MFDTSDQAIWQRLEELGTFPTLAPFSASFYAFIAELVSVVAEHDSVRLALAGLLDVELRYHRELKRVAALSALVLGDLQRLSERHRVGLEAVRGLAGGARAEEVFPAAARKLILAQCYYHLRRTDEVVEALEDVVALGVHQPLVQFALGYSRYVLALESGAQRRGPAGDVTVPDRLGFQVRCLRAVGALEEGLSGGPFDTQLYWWMGIILEAADLTEAARDAYDKSAGLMEFVASAETVETAAEIVTAEAITAVELRLAGELLKGRFHPSELWGEEPENRS